MLYRISKAKLSIIYRPGLTIPLSACTMERYRSHLIHLQNSQESRRKSDFEILHTFGDFELNAFDASHSDRLILIAKRK